jgi:thiosulfate dehydrogenase [quinone] large subunit
MISTYSNTQKNVLIIMRVLIGWHFLYEGVIKLYNPLWTAKGYLASSEGPLSGLFQWMSTDGLVGFIDTMNVAILMIVGLALILGILEKWGAILGILLLLLYYLSHPAFPGLNSGPAEGNYWIVNKNLIEAAALGVLYAFPTAHLFGIKRLFHSSGKSTEKVINP